MEFLAVRHWVFFLVFFMKGFPLQESCGKKCFWTHSDGRRVKLLTTIILSSSREPLSLEVLEKRRWKPVAPKLENSFIYCRLLVRILGCLPIFVQIYPCDRQVLWSLGLTMTKNLFSGSRDLVGCDGNLKLSLALHGWGMSQPGNKQCWCGAAPNHLLCCDRSAPKPEQAVEK